MGEIRDMILRASSRFQRGDSGASKGPPAGVRYKVEFWFTTLKIESGEDFWVEYYDGSTWHTDTGSVE